MKRKVRNIICIVWSIALVSLVLFAYRYRIIEFINDHFIGEQELGDLTMEQKVEDFEIFYSNIVESVSYLDDVQEVYGIDFKGRYDYYLQEIKNTKSNLEFYGVLQAISQDVGSFHTDVAFPWYAHLQGLSCYNSKKTLYQLGMKSKLEAWWDEFEEEIKSYEDIPYINVIYMDGKYIVSNYSVTRGMENMKDYELVSVENIPAGEYMVDNISIYNLAYDSANDTAYRTYCVFNEKIGKPVSLVWKNKQGELIEQEWYIDIGVELYDAYGYLFEESDGSTKSREASVMMHRDEENNFEYIKIDNFSNPQGEELRKYIKNSPCETIVVDLRDNYGGKKNYAHKYLFPSLYDVDVDFEYVWKVPNTTQNEKMNDEIDTKLLYLDEKDKEFYYYSEIKKYRGSAKKEKNIYYLVGRGTGSAADTYIAMIKENNLGTIVGSSTGGEGLGNSYICDALKNSSLVYVYYPAELGKEDTYNQCLGTEPDVYVNMSIEDYRKIPELNENENLSEYEKKLQYDTVLKWVIKDMKN